jgi:hypothetical protein
MSAIYDKVDQWSSGDAADLYPCRRSPILSLRQAAVRGDVERARRILRRMDGRLEASQLTGVMHLLVRQRLVPDLLRSGLRAEALSPTMQGLWLGEAVSANLAGADATLLLDAGFAPSPETLQDIRLKAIRSDAWKAISTTTFGAGQDARRRQLAWLHIHPTL